MANRWVILGVGVFAQASSSSLLYGVPFLVPAMREAEGLGLAQAEVVVAGPTVGVLLTLVAWGALADRRGERLVMAAGLALSALCVLGAWTWGEGLAVLVALLGFAGAAGASVNAASGRMVMGWFDIGERGLAMGIRQTAQPLGVGIAALSLPLLAGKVGFRGALLLPAVLCALAAVLVVALTADPPRPAREPGTVKPASPYRTPTLWRLHAASALLVMPQFAVSAFALEYLVTTRSWAAGSAGAFLAVVQVLGALGRIGAGYWSDRAGSRLRPMRVLAVASAGVLLLFALGDAALPWLAVAAIALGAVITVADNGLGFTSTAELAGTAWAGRALGVQNTGQNIVASLTPPVLGLVIGGSGYAVGFACAAAFPLLAVLATPVAAETAFRTGHAREPAG